jgi:biotin carboxyl carrier protein
VVHHDDASLRTPEERLADHAAIDHLADELLPALVAKLGASGLGELDVREGSWRVRLRMPGDGRGARRGAAPGRGAARSDGHATPGLGGTAGRVELHAAAPGHPGTAGLPAPAGGAEVPLDPDPSPTRAVATSPAVGFFRPRPDLVAGARVRSGDRLGTVDVLGVPHEIVAPVDGIVGATIIEPGDPVEYGQEVMEIELLDAPAGTRGDMPGGSRGEAD